jgi:hypothetical protein
MQKLQIKRRGAPSWLKLAKEVYDALKAHYGRLYRGAWNEVASWAAQYHKAGGSFDITQFDPAAVDPQNVKASLMRLYPPPPRYEFSDAIEQRLAMGEPPELLAQEVMRAWRRREISRGEYLRARRLLRKAGFDWSQIDKKRRARGARRAARAKDALETAKGREAVARFFGFEVPRELKTGQKRAEARRRRTVVGGKWIEIEEHGRGWRKRVRVRKEPPSYRELARQVERVKRARRGAKLLTAFL